MEYRKIKDEVSLSLSLSLLPLQLSHAFVLDFILKSQSCPIILPYVVNFPQFESKSYLVLVCVIDLLQLRLDSVHYEEITVVGIANQLTTFVVLSLSLIHI